MTFIIFHYFFFLYVFLLNKFKTFPTLKVIASEFLIAALLPIAFPPIVIDAINAVTNNTVTDELILNDEAIQVLSKALNENMNDKNKSNAELLKNLEQK